MRMGNRVFDLYDLGLRNGSNLKAFLQSHTENDLAGKGYVYARREKKAFYVGG